MLKAIFFDLDGTLLPMDEKKFVSIYFDLISKKTIKYGYDPKKLSTCILTGMDKMYKNDSGKTNEEIFWDCFKETFGEEKLRDKAVFDDFYVNEFKETINACRKNSLVKNIVKCAKLTVNKVILTTNPIFPHCGVNTRLGFIGLDSSDFDYITTYENSYHCKPNPKYFLDILEKFNLKSNEVIMFGNNDIEDYYCAQQAGIKCYLIGDSLILQDKIKLNPPIIKMDEVISIIRKEYEERL